jgi:chemotaxis protein MotB
MADPMSEKPKIKIVYKKKGGDHGGHHGGSWKVAFADFMTAMMALFMCLWILAQSQEVKAAVAYYFRHPNAEESVDTESLFNGNHGLQDNLHGRLDMSPIVLDERMGVVNQGHKGQTPESITGAAANMSPDPGLRPAPVERAHEQEVDEVRDFLDLTDELWHLLGMDPSYLRIKDQITIQTLEEGLLVQFVERPGCPLLEEQSDRLQPPIRQAISTIAKRFAKLPNLVEIDGHGLGLAQSEEHKWVGSLMLADLFRKELVECGLRTSQVSKVGGCADSRPLNLQDPRDPLNRRVSILVRPRQWRPDRF